MIENNLKTSTEVLLHLRSSFLSSLLSLSYFNIFPSFSPLSNHVSRLIRYVRSILLSSLFSLSLSFSPSLAPSTFFALSYSLFCSYSILPLLLASPKNSRERLTIKWQPLGPSTISSSTRRCYVVTFTLPLCAFFFLSFSLSLSLFSFLFFSLLFVTVSLRLNPVRWSIRGYEPVRFSVLCAASENRCTDNDHATIYRPSYDIPRSDILNYTNELLDFSSKILFSHSLSLSLSLSLDTSLLDQILTKDQHWFPIALFSACLISLARVNV